MILSCNSRVFLVMASGITLLCVTGTMTSKHAEGLALHTFAANSTASSAQEEPRHLIVNAMLPQRGHDTNNQPKTATHLVARDVKASN